MNNQTEQLITEEQEATAEDNSCETKCTKMQNLSEENKTLKSENEELAKQKIRLEQDLITFTKTLNQKMLSLLEENKQQFKTELSTSSELIKKIASEEFENQQKGIALDLIEIYNLLQSCNLENTFIANLNKTMEKILAKNQIQKLEVCLGEEFNSDVHVAANDDFSDQSGELKVKEIITSGFSFKGKKIKDAIVLLEKN